jgi:DNA-binding transcriptional MocR family regulator
MLLLKLDRKNGKPLYQQIINQIREMVENDTLKKGEALPSTREMAKTLGLDRTTIYRAYLELAALGYVVSRPGSYTRIRQRVKVLTSQPKNENGIVNWSEKSNPESRVLYDYFLRFWPESAEKIPTDLVNLSPLDLDYRLFPVTEFRRCLNQVMVNQGGKILGYGLHQGYLPLREDITQRLQVHGISITPEEILITNGAQQAIDLILKLLAIRGGTVAIESPTYANVIPLIRHYGLEIVGIPMKNNGLDLEYLTRMLQKKESIFVYSIPNFQNPTGITTSQIHRENLLVICERHKIPLIEDGFEEEMKYFGKAVLPIKSMDKKKVVIYLGTFSKVLFPGIRVGWIAADRECIQRLMAIKRFVDLTSSTLIQAAISVFIRNGYYDLHLKRMHRMFRKRLTVALNALQENMPATVSWTRPDGGYTIWVSLKNSYQDEVLLKKILIKNGVLVSPGAYYFHLSNPRKYFRISISSLNEQEIEEGITRLGRALNELINLRKSA